MVQQSFSRDGAAGFSLEPKLDQMLHGAVKALWNEKRSGAPLPITIKNSGVTLELVQIFLQRTKESTISTEEQARYNW